jgi:mannose-1-phosphate guanylyltransferase
MAGGRGTRFWPLSRTAKPKQLLPLASPRSLLRDTFERVQPLVGTDRILVITNEALVAATARELPELSPDHIIGEPRGRNTAPCAALGIGIAERLVGRVPVALLPADHWIPDADLFRRQLAAAFTHAASKGEAVTFGIPPTRPETGYGYLQVAPTSPHGTGRRQIGDQEIPAPETGASTGTTAVGGESSASGETAEFLPGVRFVEKPDQPTAVEYLADGNYYWNGGIFVWDSRNFAQALAENLPQVATATDAALANFGSSEFDPALAAAYARCPAVSIDYGVMEHVASFAVVKAAFRWSDIGSWDVWGSLASRLEESNRGTAELCAIDSQDNIIYAPAKTVALVGVSDLIVVDTADALLVCRADAAQRIREVTARLRERDREDLL